MSLATTDIFKQVQNDNPNLQKMSDTQLKKLQKILLSMLLDFDDFCQKNELVYLLGGGSCLGAVRHNGFIPWDDDIDLSMPRKDFERFRKIFPKQDGEKYWFTSPEDTKNCALAYARIRKKGTIYRTKDDEGNKQAGIYIDLSVIENTYNFAPMRSIHGFLSLALGLITSCRNFYSHRKMYLDMVKNNKKAKRTFRIKIFFGFLVSWRTEKAWSLTWNNINKMCKNNNSKYVTVPTGRKHFFGEMREREKYCKTTLCEFEKHLLPVPIKYKTYLESMYGKNYMKIPPSQKRETHAFLELDFGEKHA